MKKMLSLMLAVVLVLSSVSCFAATPEASVHEVQNNVYIEGKVDKIVDGEVLRLTLEDSEGKPVYIAEYDVDNSGKYAIKFKYQGDMKGLKLNLAYGDELVTDSAVNATATSQIMEADVFVTDANDKSYATDIDQTMATLGYGPLDVKKDGVVVHTFEGNVEYKSKYLLEERTGLKAVVNIKNKYAYEEEVSIMVAAYDKNNKLLDCKIEKKEIDYAADGELQSVETVAISVPVGTDKAKAFCWSSTSNLIALGEQADGKLDTVDIFTIGDSFGADWWRLQWPQSGWGEHLQNYFNSEYATVHNYCVSGAWAQTIMSNENDSKYLANIEKKKEDPEYSLIKGMHGWGTWERMSVTEKAKNGYGEGDYIIVSLGINDTDETGVDENGNKINSVDWYGLGLEDMVKSAKADGLNIIICTPMPNPNSGVDISDDEKKFSAKAKEVAEKYGVPYLDMVTNMKEDYKKDFGYSEEMTAAQKAEINDKVYREYHLVRDEMLKSIEDGGFGLTVEDLKYHEQAGSFASADLNYRNFHPNVKGADNMARWIAKLLKDTDSDLRFYVR